MQSKATLQHCTRCARLQAVKCVASTHSNGSTVKPVHIIGISGSLRKMSVNTGMLNTIAKHVPANATYELVSIAELPLYNDDLWAGLDMQNDDSALPETVRSFRSKVAKADGIIFACPEYNYSVSGPLKNAVDWASKGPCLFRNKLCTVVTAGGSFQGARGAAALETILTGLAARFLPPRATIPFFFVHALAYGPAFNRETGKVVDPKLEQYLKNEVVLMAETAAKKRDLLAESHVPEVDQAVKSEPVIVSTAVNSN